MQKNKGNESKEMTEIQEEETKDARNDHPQEQNEEHKVAKTKQALNQATVEDK